MFTIISTARLNEVFARLEGLDLLLLTLNNRTAKMSAALDRLTTDVGVLRTGLTNLITLTNSIAAQLRTTPVDDSDAINALADQLEQATTDVTTAVTADSPPTTPAPPSA